MCVSVIINSLPYIPFGAFGNCLDPSHPYRKHVRVRSHQSLYHLSRCDLCLMSLETAAHTRFIWIIDAMGCCFHHSSSSRLRRHPDWNQQARRKEKESSPFDRCFLAERSNSASFCCGVWHGFWGTNAHILSNWKTGNQSMNGYNVWNDPLPAASQQRSICSVWLEPLQLSLRFLFHWVCFKYRPTSIHPSVLFACPDYSAPVSVFASPPAWEQSRASGFCVHLAWVVGWLMATSCPHEDSMIQWRMKLAISELRKESHHSND